MIALLLDQGLPYSTASLLRNAGHDVQHVADLGLGEAPDDEILAVARDLGRAVCTLDGDFHALMALADATTPSVVLIRRQHLKAPAMAQLLNDVLLLVGDAISAGALITVTDSGLRIRRLPVSASSERGA